MNEVEKRVNFDIFSCDFKLDYLKFLANQGLRNFKKAYEYIEYFRDKYIDYPEKLNEIALVEMYLAAIEKNEKKYNSGKNELDKQHMTYAQKHSL